MQFRCSVKSMQNFRLVPFLHKKEMVALILCQWSRVPLVVAGTSENLKKWAAASLVYSYSLKKKQKIYQLFSAECRRQKLSPNIKIFEVNLTKWRKSVSLTWYWIWIRNIWKALNKEGHDNSSTSILNNIQFSNIRFDVKKITPRKTVICSAVLVIKVDTQSYTAGGKIYLEWIYFRCFFPSL